jgi:hypothetical protein
MAVSERWLYQLVGQHRSTQSRLVPPNLHRDRLVAKVLELALANPCGRHRQIMDPPHKER